MKYLVSLFLVLALVGCSKESEEQRNPLNEAHASGVVVDPECQLYFESQKICAKIDWTVGPTADGNSSFRVGFWTKGVGSVKGPFVQPVGKVASFLRMTCCGSISNNQVTQLSEGQYEVTQVHFMPGNWEVYVSLQNGDQTEKQFIDVSLEH